MLFRSVVEINKCLLRKMTLNTLVLDRPMFQPIISVATFPRRKHSSWLCNDDDDSDGAQVVRGASDHAMECRDSDVRIIVRSSPKRRQLTVRRL